MADFKVGDKVRMGSGRRWTGTVLRANTETVPVVTVRWDNNGAEQVVNTYMMQLELMEPLSRAQARREEYLRDRYGK
jgi:hypothetical protein